MSTPTDTQEAPGHRTSRIPSRPASRRVNSDRAATSFSVSATGSPIAAATSLPARRNVPATTTASRIPTAFRTPTSTPTYSATRPPSHVGRRSAGAQPSIPRAPSSGTTPAVEVRPSSAPHRTLSRDKPLPSPPVAQIIDPNSPPKAQRTLVDAEAGIPPAHVWPILVPEHAAPGSAELTTNYTAPQQQQQQSRRDSNRSDSDEVANTLVVDTAQPELPDGAQHLATTPDIQDTPEQHGSDPVEPHRFSSNNPYAREFHAVSPQADVAVSGPLTNGASSPMLLSIPPRVSSKRVSLPLISHLLDPSPIRAASASSAPGQPAATEWPLANAGTAVTPPARTSNIHNEQQGGYQTSSPGLDTDSIPSPTAGLVDDFGSLHNPVTGSLMRRVGGRPGRGPMLHVHRDAQAVLFGRPENFPEDFPGPIRTSFATTTARMSRQVSSRIGTTPSSPVTISPIRAMKPARRPSDSPLVQTFTSQPPPETERLVVVNPVANAEAGPDTASRSTAVSVPGPSEVSNSSQLDVKASKQTFSLKLRAQRSFRTLFGRRENVPAEARPASAETRRSSLASGARSLVKRISRNFSKEDLLVVPPVPEAELQTLEELTRERLTISPAHAPTLVSARAPTPVAAPAPAPVSAPVQVSQEPAAIHPATSRIVTEIVERGGIMSDEARDANLAIGIGEAIIEVSERASKAILSTKRAQEHAEEAQDQLSRLGQANSGLCALLRLDFDDPVLQGLKDQLQGSPFLSDESILVGGGPSRGETSRQ